MPVPPKFVTATSPVLNSYLRAHEMQTFLKQFCTYYKSIFPTVLSWEKEELSLPSSHCKDKAATAETTRKTVVVWLCCLDTKTGFGEIPATADMKNLWWVFRLMEAQCPAYFTWNRSESWVLQCIRRIPLLLILKRWQPQILPFEKQSRVTLFLKQLMYFNIQLKHKNISQFTSNAVYASLHT